MTNVIDLVKFCIDNRQNFGDKLISFTGKDQHFLLLILKTFLDISMPCMVYSDTYSKGKRRECISALVTPSEECFAVLVLENLIDVWVTQAHAEVKKEIPSYKIPEFVKSKPQARYQMIRRNQDKSLKIGHWKQEGIIRFNELLNLCCTKARKTTVRDQMEEELLYMFRNEM